MTTHHLDIWLDRRGVLGEGYEPQWGLELAISFDVEANSDEAAAELAFAVCNSYPAGEYKGHTYPAELHCPVVYADVVKRYRAEHFRSLSVGDCVDVNGLRYRVATMGFEKVVMA